MLETEFEKLSSSPLPKSYIDFVFCNRMNKRSACFLKLDSNCNRCLPVLQGVITHANEHGDNIEALLVYLLQEIGSGRRELWESVEKKAINQGIYYKPEENLFLKLKEGL